MTSTTHQPALARTGWLSAARRPLTTMIATNFLSVFSNQLTAIAVPWFVLTLTGSATQTGLAAAVTILPSVIMSFFGGALVDRMSARKTGTAHKIPRHARDDAGFGAGMLVMRGPR